MKPLYCAPESNPSIASYRLISTRIVHETERRGLDIYNVKRTYETYTILYRHRRTWIEQEYLRCSVSLGINEVHAYNW